MQKSIIFKKATLTFSDIGKGTAVVLLHGFLENTTMWKEIAPELSKKNRVISIDLLGHGNTDCLGYVHSMELMAETVTAVLKHLRIRKCVLIGHSMGGYVSLAFTEKHPDKVKGLCLLNSTSLEDDEDRKALRTRANKMIQTNFTNMVRMSFSNLFGPKSKTAFSAEIEAALQEALQTPLQGYMAANEGMKTRPNRKHILAKNHFKKMMVIGKNDPVLNATELIKEAKETNTETVIFANGHMSHIENKQKVINTLTRFLHKC